MKFEVEGEAPIDQPTAAQVDEGLRTLQPSERTFAILAREDWTYIQTAFDGDGTFVLEYQDGSLEQHYRASRPLLLQEVIGAFQSYLRQDGAWRSGILWERLEL